MTGPDGDCGCNKKICEYCNGTGQVPEIKQNVKNWWLKEPLPGEVWTDASLVTCKNCNGLGKIRRNE